MTEPYIVSVGHQNKPDSASLSPEGYNPSLNAPSIFKQDSKYTPCGNVACKLHFIFKTQNLMPRGHSDNIS